MGRQRNRNPRGSNAARGWSNQRKGNAFQKEINDLVVITRGARIVEQHWRVRWPSKSERKPPGWVQIIGKGWVDYIGFYYGIAFTFDAKRTSDEKAYNVPLKKEHQLQKLKDSSAAGTCAFYLIDWEHYDQIGIHPVFPDRKTKAFRHNDPAAVLFDRGGRNWLQENLLLYVLDYYGVAWDILQDGSAGKWI